MLLSEEFVKDHLLKAKGSLMFGHKIEDLSKDELIACIVYLNEITKDQKEKHSKNLDNLINLHAW